MDQTTRALVPALNQPNKLILTIATQPLSLLIQAESGRNPLFGKLWEAELLGTVVDLSSTLCFLLPMFYRGEVEVIDRYMQAQAEDLAIEHNVLIDYPTIGASYLQLIADLGAMLITTNAKSISFITKAYCIKTLSIGDQLLEATYVR